MLLSFRCLVFCSFVFFEAGVTHSAVVLVLPADSSYYFDTFNQMPFP